MALNIFGTDPDEQPKRRSSFADDVVGRFRSGYQVNNRPAALTEWRVTTGDPDVAAKVHDLLGGEVPQEWEAKGEDNLEVFTASPSVNIIIENAGAVRQRMILWGRNGKPIQEGDGQTLSDGTPDPDADLSFNERKKKGQDGIGPVPQIEVFFRLADEPELGIFKFTTGSWSLAYDLAADAIDRVLDGIDGPASATLALEEVSFVAKKGPRAGQTVQYTKPILKVNGPAA